MILRAAYLAPLLFLSAPVMASDLAGDATSLAQRGEAPRKHSVLITYGDDACPESTDGEIIVCARQPESERYRVPKELREELKEQPVTGGSWANAVEDYDDIARIGRPNSCSAVGTNGATGCASAALRQWQAERRNRPQ